jgi:hypothetical protein
MRLRAAPRTVMVTVYQNFNDKVTERGTSDGEPGSDGIGLLF